jgi:hypothetical protein
MNDFTQGLTTQDFTDSEALSSSHPGEALLSEKPRIIRIHTNQSFYKRYRNSMSHCFHFCFLQAGGRIAELFNAVLLENFFLNGESDLPAWQVTKRNVAE